MYRLILTLSFLFAILAGQSQPNLNYGKEFLYQGAIVRSIAAGGPGMYFECKMKANATKMTSTFWLMTKYDCYKKL